MSCGRIERGSAPDCDNIPTGGTVARLILINWDDVLYIYEGNGSGGVEGSVWDESFDYTFGPMVSASSGLGVITQIVLKPGKQGYEFFGFRNDVKKSEEVQQVNNRKRFLHACGFVIYEIDELQKANIRNMSKGRFMAIVENLGKGPDAFELLGRECGLKIVQGVIRETEGFYSINLATPGNGIEFERRLPQTLGTSYSNAEEIIDELLNSSDEGFITEDETAIFESEDGQIFVVE